MFTETSNPMLTIYIVSNVEDLWLGNKVGVLRRNASVGRG